METKPIPNSRFLEKIVFFHEVSYFCNHWADIVQKVYTHISCEMDCTKNNFSRKHAKPSAFNS